MAHTTYLPGHRESFEGDVYLVPEAGGCDIMVNGDGNTRWFSRILEQQYLNKRIRLTIEVL